MNPAPPEKTFVITHEEGRFVLRDARGHLWDTCVNPKRLEKLAWSHGAQILRSDYDLRKGEA